MIRLRCIASIRRARVVNTGLVHKTFLSSKVTIDSETPRNGQNVDTETKMKHHIKTDNITDALKLFEESRNGGNSWKVDGCYSSLLHMFVQHDQHEAVDKLYEDIKRNSSFIGEGARTTMIKSYCNRGLFDQAAEMLRAIANDNIVHHTRHYDYLITRMAERGLAKEALQVFEEKLERQQNTLYSKSDIYFKDIVYMIKLLLNPNNLKADGGEQFKGGDVDEYLYNRMSQRVLSYLQKVGERLPGKLLQAVHLWFDCDPVYHWKWKKSSVSEVGMCSSCGNQLITGIPPSAVHQLECEIIKLSNSPQQDLSRMRGKNLGEEVNKELEHLKTFVQERGPFDVIIDGMNVGFLGTGSKAKFLAARLVETARHFVAQQKKVLVVVNKCFQWKITNLNLEDVCAVFWDKYASDDLYVLYAAAFSGMQHVEIVTNDKLKDHRLLLPTDLWWTYLRWTRLNCISFTGDETGKLRFFRQKVDPVVQRCGNSWHFPVNDQTWRCVTKLRQKRRNSSS